MKRDVTRREFLNLIGKGSGALVGISIFGLPGFEKLLAASLSEVPIIWLQASACTGCSVSVLNTLSPRIQDILLDQIIPGTHLSLVFHPTIMAGQGNSVIKILDTYKSGKSGNHVLIIEGAVPTKDDGHYCEVGEKDGRGIPILEHVLELAQNAIAVLNLGTCSSYGGIPAAPPNPTGCKPVGAILKEHGITTSVVNLPGCPSHPDWFVGTVATILMGGLKALDLDSVGRPQAFYGTCIHDHCELRGHFDAGDFAKDFSDHGCLYELGCRGPETFADCPERRWNSATNWCIGCGSPCNGCVEPEYPYENAIYQTVPIHAATAPSTYPPVSPEKETGISTGAAVILGALAGAAASAGYSLAAKRTKPDMPTSEEEP